MAVQGSIHRVEVSAWTVALATLAGALMLMAGIFQAFQGLAAIFNGDFFVVGPNYTYSIDTTTWGWIHLFLGTILAFAGGAVFSGQAWGRTIGIILAIVSAIANFFYIPYYPLWSILIIVLDVAIISALAGYGTEQAEALE